MKFVLEIEFGGAGMNTMMDIADSLSQVSHEIDNIAEEDPNVYIKESLISRILDENGNTVGTYKVVEV